MSVSRSSCSAFSKSHTCTTTLQETNACWTRIELELAEQIRWFSSPEFFKMLVTVAKFLPVDISHIESLHAAIRRLLYIRSTHTHSMSIKDLSAQWVCMQFRRGAKRSGQRPGAPKRLTRKKRIKEKKQQKKGVIAKQKARKRPGKGGAWRAWIRGQGKA